MKCKSRVLTAIFLTICMIMMAMPVSAFADSDAAAKIGETTYTTLGEAITAVNGGETIELLKDSDLNIAFGNKEYTIKGTETGKNLNLNTNAVDGKITLDGLTINGVNNSELAKGENSWGGLVIGNSSSLTLSNCNMNFKADSNGKLNEVVQPIYLCTGSTFSADNSTIDIENFESDAIGFDGDATCNFSNSTVTLIGCRAGVAGPSATINISESNFRVNSRGNAFNGQVVNIKDSTVDISNNGANGISASNLEINNSTVTANGNGMTGIYVGVKGDFIKSNITIEGIKGNYVSTWTPLDGGLCVKKNAIVTVDQETTLSIMNNNAAGIALGESSKLTIDSPNVTIAHNAINYAGNNLLINHVGGGVTVSKNATANLGSAMIYDNHALTAGDDIYVDEGGTVNFTTTPIDRAFAIGEWKGTKYENSNWYAIDGWYKDDADSRWSFDKAIIDKAESKTGPYALKAAAHINNPVNPPHIDINKNLDVNGNIIPHKTFIFNIAGVEGLDGTTKIDGFDAYTGVTDGMATQATVSFNGSETVNNDIVTASTFFDLSGVEYTNPGVYRYVVTEIPDADNNYTYDEKEIYVNVYVGQDENGENKIIGIIAYNKDGEKIEDIDFNNEYNTQKLEVKKVVTGTLGDRNKDFNFAIYIEGNDNLPEGSILKLYVNGDQTDYTVGSILTFTLKHGQSATIAGIPEGTNYVVREITDDMAQQIKDGNVTELPEQEEVIGDYTVAVEDTDKGTMTKENGENATVTIINNNNATVPTGIILGGAGFAAAIAVGGGLLIASKRKKREDDEE